MTKRYAIWNRTDPIITPVGEVLTAEQWIERYPVAGIKSITPIVSAGEINGGFFGTLGQMCQMFEAEGCDFSGCTTAEERLEAIEVFEYERNKKAAEDAKAAAEREAETAELSAASMASIAAQLEYQNMMTLEDVEV